MADETHDSNQSVGQSVTEPVVGEREREGGGQM